MIPNTVFVPLTRGQVAIIDELDVELVLSSSWQATKRRDGNGFYAMNSSGVRMHRLITGAGGSVIVDHRDGNGLNNVRSNLRIGTQSQNCVNRRTTPGSYLRGVRKKKDKWQAYIKYAGKQKSLGYFDTEIEAHNAYLSAANELHGDWMPLPEPPKGTSP